MLQQEKSGFQQCKFTYMYIFYTQNSSYSNESHDSHQVHHTLPLLTSPPSYYGCCLTLMYQLVERMLSICARLSPHDGTCGVVHTSTRPADALTIGLHVTLHMRERRGKERGGERRR